MPGPIYHVENTIEGAGVFFDIDAEEYERWLELGILLNGPSDPLPEDYFDQEVAELVNDTTSATYAAGRARFSLRAQTIAPSNPAVGDLWVS